MPLSLLNHSALALFAQRTRIPTSARSIGFCAIWVCISSSFWFLETKHMGLVRCFSRHLPGYFVSISFLRGVSQVGSEGTEKRQIANSCTGSPCI